MNMCINDMMGELGNKSNPMNIIMIDGKEIKMKIFYDVDTQNDFMNKDGALYVPDAESIKDNLAKLADYAEENDIRILGSIDRHFKGDAELSANGGPFPNHCMDGEDGMKKILQTMPVRRVKYIQNPQSPEGPFLTDIGVQETIEDYPVIIFEKQHYDVSTNPEFEKIVKALNPEEMMVIMYGVATDYCVYAAAKAFSDLGAKVVIVKDAIKGVDLEDSSAKIDELVDKYKVELTTTEGITGAK